MAIWPPSFLPRRPRPPCRLVARPRDRHDVGAAALARLLEARIDRRQHLARADQARADGGDKIVGARLLEVGAHAVEALVGDRRSPPRGRSCRSERLAELDVLLALAGADEAADRGLGLAGDDEALPGRRRRLRLRGDDLDLVAVGELRAQRQHAAVDLGADAGVADLAVDGIGEVDRRRAARQGDQLALGREAEHLVLEHLELGVLEEFLGVGRLVEDVDQAAQPAHIAAHRSTARPACRSSARRRRARPGPASPRCGSGSRCAGRADRSRRCAASGSRSAWAPRCSP